MSLFQNPTIDPALWRGPDIAGNLLGGMQGMMNIRADQAYLDRLNAQAEQQNREAAGNQAWDQAVQMNPGEGGLAELYRLNAGRAMAYEKQMRELQQMRAASGKTMQEARKTAGEADEADTKLFTNEAIGAAHLLSALPPDRRNIQALAPFLMSRAGFYQDTRPDIAAKLQQAAQSPDSITHIMAIAQGAGYKDPNEEMQRDLYKSNAQAQFQNQLPPTPYQRAQLEQQGQQNRAQTAQQNWGMADSLRKEFNALPEATTLSEILPLSQAVRQASAVDNQAADLDMIYGVARMLDPKGVVRESDSSMVVQTGSPAQQMMGYWNRVIGGGKLTPEIRKNLLALADRREQAARTAYDARRQSYGQMAAQRGIDPAMVFSEPMQVQGRQAPQQAAAQSSGAFREGQTATNKQTGQRMVYRGGQWQPL